MEYALIVNTGDCVGCYACEVACKQEHNLPVGPRWIRVFPTSDEEFEYKPRLRYTVIYCMHCSQPACQDVCPVGAITKRDDGIVLVQQELCNGCGECIEACPLGVMQFDQERGLAQKCDLCVERIDAGLVPACVAACPSHCIHFGDVADIIGQLGELELLNQYKAGAI